MRKANDLFCKNRSLARDNKTSATRRLTAHHPRYAHQLANSKEFQLYRNPIIRSLFNIQSA